jgi:hypothetical protein
VLVLESVDIFFQSGDPLPSHTGQRRHVMKPWTIENK